MARVTTNLLRYRIAIAAQEGADVEAVLRVADAPPGLMEGDPEHVDEYVERRVWSAIIAETGREDIGLVCGVRFPTQAISMLGYVMANAPTVRAAIEKCCTYQRVIGDTMGLVIDRDADTSTVWIEQWSDWHDTLRFTVDMIMAGVTSWASANAIEVVKPLRVGFHYQRPADTGPYDELFSPALVSFGSEVSYLIFANDSLDQPIIGASGEMYGFFEEKVRRLLNDFEGRDTYAFKTRQRILAALKGTTPNVDLVASELAVSSRKLQQKLTEEGTSFSRLLSETRRDLAKQHLQEGEVGNDEIAYLLGYSEVSVFSRSFKKWTGTTPGEFRTQATVSSP